ncbi:MAG: Na/Pi symporter [Cyanobacteria bacterium P01_D01_bin.156]
MVTPSPQGNSTPVANADTTAVASSNMVEESINPQEEATVAEPLKLGQSCFYVIAVMAAVYGLLASIDLLAIGFQSILGPQAEELLNLAANPWLGLLVGIITTALIQSSSLVTTLLVGLVAGGLPITTAIPMVMGANLGTTITNTLVSLGYIGNDEDFERSFAAATVHDCFNLLALVLFFPLEILLHPFEKLSQWVVSMLPGGMPIPISLSISPVDWLVKPSRWLIAYGVNHMPGPWDSLLLFGCSVGGLMISVTALSWLIKHWLSEPLRKLLYWTTGHGSKLGGLASGIGITALLQSSSVTTSLMIPLAGAGTLTLEEIYPFVLGANVGTCVTAVLATLAVNNQVALQLALVHVSYNILAVTLIYGISPLRDVPLKLAQQLATATRNYRIVSVAYVVGVFFLLPFLTLWLSSLWIT